MKKILIPLAAMLLLTIISCGDHDHGSNVGTIPGTFNWNPDNFADKKIVRYTVEGFDNLSLDQKQLVYYLTQAGMSGRDIIYDQLYRHNLTVRRALEKVINDYKGERSGGDWDCLLYTSPSPRDATLSRMPSSA